MVKNLLVVKNLPANAGDARDTRSIPGSGRCPGEVSGTPVFLPGGFHGQKSLAGLQSMGSQRDTTEQLSTCREVSFKLIIRRMVDHNREYAYNDILCSRVNMKQNEMYSKIFCQFEIEYAKQ